MKEKEVPIGENQYDSLSTQEIYRKPKILVADRDAEFLDWLTSNSRNILCDFVVCQDISSALLQASSKKFDGLIVAVYGDSESKSLVFAEEVRRLPDK
ncbi:MAG: hypothetical protein K8F91_19850, partial [Candidatus Obscuribacterales bacterium]|nr:hypothetical protein [Candidatus Obscuribacterales bacterium]